MDELKEITELKTRIKKYFTEEEVAKIEKALEYASIKHASQKRDSSGAPYIVHPVSVALILLDYGIDADTICAALLHDVLEDTETKIAELKSEFGNSVAELVNGVSRVKTLKYKPANHLVFA